LYVARVFLRWVVLSQRHFDGRLLVRQYAIVFREFHARSHFYNFSQVSLLYGVLICNEALQYASRAAVVTSEARDLVCRNRPFHWVLHLLE